MTLIRRQIAPPAKRYLVISVALVRYGPVSEYAVARPERALTARRIISKPLATRVDLALDKAFVIMDRQRPYAGKVAPLAAECYCESLFSTRRIAGRGPCVEPAALRRHFAAGKQSRPQAHASQPRPPTRNVPLGWSQ